MGGWGFVLQTFYRSGYDVNQISLFRSRKFDWQHYLSLVLSFMFYMLKCVTVSFRIRLPRCPNIRATAVVSCISIFFIILNHPIHFDSISMNMVSLNIFYFTRQ